MRDRARRIPDALLAKLRDDPRRDMAAARVGDRAYFRPDGLFLEVTGIEGGVTSRVTAPADAPELGAERSVSLEDWQGMLDEGTLLCLPEPPRVGEVWSDPQYGLWFVKEVSGGEVVFEDIRGETSRCGLGPDGQPDDGHGWFRVGV